MLQDVALLVDLTALEHRGGAEGLGDGRVPRLTAHRLLIGRLVGVHRSFLGCDGARQCFTHVAEPFADTFLLGDVTEGFFEHPEYLAVRAHLPG